MQFNMYILPLIASFTSALSCCIPVSTAAETLRCLLDHVCSLLLLLLLPSAVLGSGLIIRGVAHQRYATMSNATPLCGAT